MWLVWLTGVSGFSYKQWWLRSLPPKVWQLHYSEYSPYDSCLPEALVISCPLVVKPIHLPLAALWSSVSDHWYLWVISFKSLRSFIYISITHSQQSPNLTPSVSQSGFFSWLAVLRFIKLRELIEQINFKFVIGFVKMSHNLSLCPGQYLEQCA